MNEQPHRSYAVPVPKGYRVGAWEVRAPLASGAFSTVYAARHTGDEEPELPREAALKFLPTGTRTPRQLRHLRELAEREVELLEKLRAPRLIRMYDTLTVDDPDHPELDGATVLVLERAEGSLDAVLEHTPRPEAGPALLAQICEGLHQLHHAGWVHGDLKPANVLLLKDVSVRLADFNMAAELQGTHAYAPAFATPDYTPPELLWPEIDERGARIRPSADIWAFGVLAHVVLTGTFPLPGGTTEARCDAATRYARGTEELRLSPELPDAWREIVRDCLGPTHADRIGTEALLRRAEQAAGSARSARLPRLRPRRWRRPVLVAALAAVALGTATTVTYTLRDEAPAAAAAPTCEKPTVYEDTKNGRGYTAGWSSTWDFTVKQGEGGSQVRELQCLLRHLHGITEVGEVDGGFGPLTKAAVVAFQKRAELDADGIVGPKTWQALRQGPDGVKG
ncbi:MULTISPECIES: serine/threonine-protein kinase [unclassified Streptomyces]|uniref:serine/threonine-protein kinase n=1 Tax=unclassified Streptomyces TaxID=2593676 RepID=UPI002257328B|nr:MULTISPECIES: serine/threonine-protein kinase [unclassified Streptomyces]MCX5050540.1 serine/threonine-protein kinase [Streptomyces sp. NBC_00474]MCX5060918.1 serine/threonine-protein kinase [Streptomyces sp. NBC_00452]MCX5248449.1 serine/threonine-protein kinase [Streptomyces sp. NBC_00201]MCX5293457.1 serine/threonine-protein kinase [Streptomyces sp. NBC_00183]MCX5423132.1 serine/threonine-protein kinase [Streptomyces sp. NBC_00078]